MIELKGYLSYQGNDPLYPNFLQNVTVTYENCGCVAANLYNNITESDFSAILANSTATRGLCTIPCSYLAGFITLVTIFVILIFLIRVPFLLVTLR